MDTPLLIDDFWHETQPLVMGALDGDLPNDERLEDHVLFRTSGSMGAPKWVALSKAALMVSAEAVNRCLGVGERSVWGMALPSHHVGGFGVMVRAHEAGCGLEVFAEPWDPLAFTAWVANARVTHTSLVPTQVHDLVQAGAVAPAALRVVVVGGGALSAETGQAARDLGWPVLASYGMTEAGSQIATQGLRCLDQPFEPAPIPVMDHWQVREEQDGRLSIAGQALFSAVLVKQGDVWVYQQRDGEWFETSDRVSVDGQALTPHGRADLRVKVLGELVDIEAIEAKIVGVSDGVIPEGSIVVAAVPNERAGHALVPVCDAALDRDTVATVMYAYAAEAPGFARLQAPRFLDPFPRSELGKPLRAECLNQAVGR